MGKETFFGIDLGEKNSIISFYDLEMPEPESVSTVAGSENFQILTFIAKRKGMGQWFYGEEAKEQVRRQVAIGVDRLLERALLQEEVTIEGEVYAASDLLLLFLRKVIHLPEKLYMIGELYSLAISVPKVDERTLRLFTPFPKLLNIPRDKFFVVEHRESFYHYALNANSALWKNDVALFDYQNNHLSRLILQRNQSTTPQVISFDEDHAGALLNNKDLEFKAFAEKAFEGRSITSVYLIGDGFDGDWMNESLPVICKNRRVFLGKNLYSKGAAYIAAQKSKNLDWPYLFMGDHELKINLLLKVYNNSNLEFHTLISAGISWYDVKGECEVLLDGSPEVEIWAQRPEVRQPIVEVLPLPNLPERPPKATRLRITATPSSDSEIHISIKDLGFGEIYKSSGLHWEYDLSYKEN